MNYDVGVVKKGKEQGRDEIKQVRIKIIMSESTGMSDQ